MNRLKEQLWTPVNCIVANLYHGVFWKGSPLHCLHPSRHWFRFVDDTFVIQQESHKQLLLDHINNIDPAIMFTVEGNQENGTISFLDTLVKPEANNSLSISVYRKSSHTDQYLQWDSHHNLATKYSVIGTLAHKAKTVCTGLKLFNKEIQQLREALSRCIYSKWALDKIQSKFITWNWQEANTQQNSTSQRDNNISSNTTEGTPLRKNLAQVT